MEEEADIAPGQVQMPPRNQGPPSRALSAAVPSGLAGYRVGATRRSRTSWHRNWDIPAVCVRKNRNQATLSYRA